MVFKYSIVAKRIQFNFKQYLLNSVQNALPNLFYINIRNTSVFYRFRKSKRGTNLQNTYSECKLLMFQENPYHNEYENSVRSSIKILQSNHTMVTHRSCDRYYLQVHILNTHTARIQYHLQRESYFVYFYRTIRNAISYAFLLNFCMFNKVLKSFSYHKVFSFSQSISVNHHSH